VGVDFDKMAINALRTGRWHESQQPPELTIKDFFDQQYSAFRRYWWRHGNRYSLDVRDHVAFHARLLGLAKARKSGRALDLGAGEGSDAIRLALLGYEVDAVDISPVAADKIATFCRQVGANVNVHNMDAAQYSFSHQYDVIICNGLLHYVEGKEALLARMMHATVPGGLNMISLFSTYTSTPECHRIVPVHPDDEHGTVVRVYRGWKKEFLAFDRDRLEKSHPGFEPHRHSYIKMITRKAIGGAIPVN